MTSDDSEFFSDAVSDRSDRALLLASHNLEQIHIEFNPRASRTGASGQFHSGDMITTRITLDSTTVDDLPYQADSVSGFDRQKRVFVGPVSTKDRTAYFFETSKGPYMRWQESLQDDEKAQIRKALAFDGNEYFQHAKTYFQERRDHESWIAEHAVRCRRNGFLVTSPCAAETSAEEHGTRRQH